MNEVDRARLGLIPLLAERASAGHIGRTALMKYMYFLQTLRGLPLGYNFTMYSYGPFDSAVLSDLSSAELLNIVEMRPVQFPGGYGYRIKPGSRAEHARGDAADFLALHEGDVAWLFSAFGTFNSAELELASTIVYVDQEFADMEQSVTIPEIITRVQEIKPHFTRKQIEGFVDSLLKKGVLRATVRTAGRPC